MADDRIKQEKELLNLTTKRREELEKINQLIEDNQKAAQDSAKINQQSVSIENEKLSSIEKELNAQEKQIKFNKDSLKNSENILRQSKIRQEYIESILEDEKQIAELSEESVTELQEELSLLKDKNKELEAILKRKQEELETTQNLLQIQEHFADVSQKIQEFVFGTANYEETFLGTLEKVLTTSGGLTEAWKSFTKNLNASRIIGNLFYGAITKVAESTAYWGKELNETISSFNQLTMTGNQYNQVLDDARFGMMSAGIGMQQSAKSLESLYTGFTEFTSLNRQTQTELVKTGALLEKAGISSATFAENLNIGTKVLGMNLEESKKFNLEIANVASSIGLIPEELAKSFSTAAPELAQYGNQATEVFKKLATQSKATGLSVQELIGISSKFSTFESAAESAGKLNAILGGNLINSVELLTASESERVGILRQTVLQSGRSWDSMNRFEKQAIASAAGISDLSKAAMLFGQSEEEFRRVSEAQKNQALSVQNLTEHAKNATSVQEKMSLITQSLTGAALPLVDAFSKVLNVILEISDKAGKGFYKWVVGITGALFGLMVLMKTFVGVVQLATATEAAYLTVKKSTFLLKVKDLAISALQKTAMFAIIGATAAMIFIEESYNKIKNLNILATIKNISLSAIEKASVIAATAAKLAKIAVEKTYNAITKSSIFLSIKKNALSAIERVSVMAVTAAILVQNGILWLYNAAKNANILTTIKNIAIQTAENIAVWATTAGLIALQVAQWAATAATTAFGIAVAIATSPVTLIILAIGALIAAVAALIIYWDDINETISNVTDGFFDIKDALLFLSGPIGWMILAGKKLYENWELVADKISNAFVRMKNVVMSAFSAISGTLKMPLNAAGSILNRFIGSANVLPGVNLPTIPKFAKGVDGFAGGTAIVGEAGPELITSGQGSNVVNNKNLEKLFSTVQNLEKNISSVQSTVINQNTLNKNASAGAPSSATKSDIQKPIILQLNGRELARAVINIVEGELKLNTINN